MRYISKVVHVDGLDWQATSLDLSVPLIYADKR